MADTVPVLKQNQLAFLRAYRELEIELKRAPSLNELADRTGYTKPGAQKLAAALAEKGLIEMPQLIGGGMTDLGKEALKRYRGIE